MATEAADSESIADRQPVWVPGFTHEIALVTELARQPRALV
jgi:hypothetical protein